MDRDRDMDMEINMDRDMDMDMRNILFSTCTPSRLILPRVGLVHVIK